MRGGGAGTSLSVPPPSDPGDRPGRPGRPVEQVGQLRRGRPRPQRVARGEVEAEVPRGRPVPDRDRPAERQPDPLPVGGQLRRRGVPGVLADRRGAAR